MPRAILPPVPTSTPPGPACPQELYIKGNDLGDEGVKAICEALKGHAGEAASWPVRLPAARVRLLGARRRRVEGGSRSVGACSPHA